MKLLERITEREEITQVLAESIRRTDVQRCSYCGKTACPHSFNGNERVWAQDHNAPQPVYEHGSWR